MSTATELRQRGITFAPEAGDVLAGTTLAGLPYQSNWAPIFLRPEGLMHLDNADEVGKKLARSVSRFYPRAGAHGLVLDFGNGIRGQHSPEQFAAEKDRMAAIIAHKAEKMREHGIAYVDASDGHRITQQEIDAAIAAVEDVVPVPESDRKFAPGIKVGGTDAIEMYADGAKARELNVAEAERARQTNKV
jgi:hypothetical protein